MILGVNTSHDASFCLLDATGQPAYVLEEERFNRVKHTPFGTTLSLEWLIREGLLNPEAVTDIVYSFEMGAEREAHLLQRCYENIIAQFGRPVFDELARYFHQPEHNFSPTLGLGLAADYDETVERLRAMFPNAVEGSYMHHLCHAASAFYPSPFAAAAVLVVDGAGRLETTTIWKAGPQGIELARQIALPNSIGLLYWLFSSYVCLEEGQVMGLAPYGRPIYADTIYSRILVVDADGGFRLKAPIIAFSDMSADYALQGIEEIFGHKTRTCRGEPLTQFHADIAASIQQVTEEILLKLALDARQRTGEENLCLAGGVIQNCVANGLLVKSGIFSDIWVQPMANDCGTALGAALVRHYESHPAIGERRWRMVSPQLGVANPPERTEALLQQLGVPYREVEASHEVAAQWIAEGHVVGWFQGRAEVGPRALGGRSLLADPTRHFSYFRANEIKQRQPWRPLAPSMIESAAGQFMEVDRPSPYMILSFDIRPEKRAVLPAVCHIDGSTRPQTVTPHASPLYYALLQALEKAIGVPVALNTSFNLGGEPIVQHPLEALRDFLLSGIDRLILDRFAIDAKPVLAPAVIEALKATRFVVPYVSQLQNAWPLILAEHASFTSAQGTAARNVQTLLDWAHVRVRRIDGTGLREALTEQSGQARAALISAAPYLDESWVAGLPADCLERLDVAVLDRQGFMALTPASRYLAILDRNRRNLLAQLNERQAVVAGRTGEVDEILQTLKLFGVPVAGFLAEGKDGAGMGLAELAPAEIQGRAGNYCLVMTGQAASSLASRLESLAYRSGSDTVTWEA